MGRDQHRGDSPGRGAGDRDTERRQGRSGDAVAPTGRAEQVRLPFSSDEPIPFALTARARRAVAPESLPSLTVVDPDPGGPRDPGDTGQPSFEDAVPDEPDDPHDTRPSRARALRRAGVAMDDIATELDVDELVVRAWVDDVAPVRSARRRLRSVPAGRPPRAREQAEADAARRRHEDAFASARAAARAGAGDRVRQDPSFVSGLGLVSGIAEISPHAIVLTGRDRDVLAAALRWLTATTATEPRQVRVVLRISPQAAADRVAHEWADVLGVVPDRVTTTRWRNAPDAESAEAMVRVADARAAGAVAGWRDALLQSLGGGDDAGDTGIAF